MKMARFEDSPNLFGYGVGDSTDGEVICEICGNVYNKGIGIDENNEDEDCGDSVRYTEFAGLQVCECCFDKIENEILKRMPDILSWYKRVVESQKKSVQDNEALLKGLQE
jgi:hypothetical protein